MKYLTIFLLCLSLFGYITIVQAQEVVKDNARSDYKTVDDNLLLQSKMRIAEINSTLEKHKEGRLGKAIMFTGILGLTGNDLVTNHQTISKSRKTWDWVGLTISAGVLVALVNELVEDNTLKKERKTLEKICLQQQLIIESQNKMEIVNWEKAKSVNTLISYQKYLDQYPTGRFINEAKAGMEIPLWEEYSSENTVTAYLEYLNQYPSGRYVEEARNKIDEPIWRDADSLKSLTGYKNYLKLYPTGKYSKDAQARISEIYKEPTEILVGTWNCIDNKNKCSVQITFYPDGDMKLIDESGWGSIVVGPLQHWRLELSNSGSWMVSMSGDSRFRYERGSEWADHPSLLMFSTCTTSNCYYDLYGGSIEGKAFILDGFTCTKIK